VPTTSATATSNATMTTARFIDTIGVVMRIDQGTVHYGNVQDDLSDLRYLGIHNTRNGAGGPYNTYLTLAQNGIKFDLGVVGGNTSNAIIDSEFTNVIDALNKAVPGAVNAVEGANEVNNFALTYNGQSGYAAALAAQQYIYAKVHADPLLQGTAVYYFTGWGAGSAIYGNIPIGPNPATTPGLADYDNNHPYPSGGNPPAAAMSRTANYYNENPATGPGVYTEAGYSDSGGFGSTLNQTGVAKYMLDLLMDDAKNNIFRTYLYELMDGGDGLGLFDANNNAKPVATAIHNLTSILVDSGSASPAATPANYSISSLPVSGQSMALLKANGATDIVVWAEPKISGSTPSPATTVTVNLGATYGTVKIFDPLQGTGPIQTLSNVSSTTISVSDHPIIVETEPGSTPVQPPPPPPPPPPVVSPNDTVVLAGSTAAITDAAGNKWTITSGGQIAVNGVVDPVTYRVTELAYVNGVVWQEDFANLWWGKTSPDAAWMPTAGTSTSPLPPTKPPVLDTVMIRVSEDAYQGDAQFVVRMDGKQVGGTLTASANHASGDSNVFTLTGTWGQSTTHDVQIQFLNDLYAGTPATDRNLYVSSIAYDGVTYAGTSAAMMSAGNHDFMVGATTPTMSAPADSLTLHLSEDAYLGNAQFALLIDGKTIAAPHDATALHSSGQWNDVTFAGNFGTGNHTIGVAFTNDAWGGTATTDRNLYVNGIDVNGTHYGTGVTALTSNGTATFTVMTAH
jgi:hypothetical protein